jgi:hypothetical protein
MPFTIITGGSFTSTGAGVRIPLPSSADYFVTTNVTQMALAPATGVVVRAEWFGPKFGVGASASNSGLRWKKTDSTSAININSFSTATASDGFTYVTVVPQIEPQAPNAITSITAASPAVVTQTNTYSENDIIQFYGTTGMLQIAGMNFQISTVSGSGYTLTGLRAAGFSAAATAGFTRRISKYLAVDPQFLYITEITKATQAVVRTSVDPTAYYVVGMKVHFSIPYSFGMTQMDQLTGTIVAMSSTNYTMTVDIDSSAFTTFAFPASTSSPSVPLFATLAPAGASTQLDPVTHVQTGYDFQFQPFRTGQFTPYMFLAGGAQSPAGAASDVIDWIAYKFEN